MRRRRSSSETSSSSYATRRRLVAASAQLPLEVRSLGRRRRASTVILETASDLTTDERRVRHEAHDVFPNEIVNMILTDGTVVANPPASALAGSVGASTTIVDVPAATSSSLRCADVSVAAASTGNQPLQQRRLLRPPGCETSVLFEAAPSQLEHLVRHDGRNGDLDPLLRGFPAPCRPPHPSRSGQAAGTRHPWRILYLRRPTVGRATAVGGVP